MAFVNDISATARWGLKMAFSTDGAINELPPAMRRIAYAALIGISLTAAYFMFVEGPIADAQTIADRNGKRIDAVEGNIATIKGDISDMKATSAARDQKLDDVKEAVAAMNTKLDRLLMRGQKPSLYPP